MVDWVVPFALRDFRKSYAFQSHTRQLSPRSDGEIGIKDKVHWGEGVDAN